jgi:hypothetical protein
MYQFYTFAMTLGILRSRCQGKNILLIFENRSVFITFFKTYALFNDKIEIDFTKKKYY